MIRIKSLQQRFAVFILFPVGLLLLFMGVLGFFYIQDKLLSQWGEAAILKLQRAAHHVDMRLSRPHELLTLAESVETEALRESVLRRLKKVKGVVRVDYTRSVPSSEATGTPSERPCPQMKKIGGISFSPIKSGDKTISLVLNFKNGAENTHSRVEAVLSLGYIVGNVMDTGWWQSSKAYLVDSHGHIIAGTIKEGRRTLGETGAFLEKKTLAALEAEDSGIVFGKGHPAREVSGFYRLSAAPWHLVMFAPGKEILAPATRFIPWYIGVGACFILFILMIIRRETGRTAASIIELSDAANRLTRNEYGDPLEIKSMDEVGRLTDNFNIMVRYFKERSRLKASMNLAMEVQQSLLPRHGLELDELDISGDSFYCDETGGDYYDFLEFPDPARKRVGIAVGDVVGHGIAAALLMTTVRALLRSRICQPGSLSEIMFDVNRSFCLDTDHTGNFMTLFFMSMDTEKRELRWVRAGHEPAIVYDKARDEFTELKGNGIALGIDERYCFEENSIQWNENQLLFIGTDGIWETENPHSERFGKDRFFQLIRQNRKRSSREIILTVKESLSRFRGSAKQEDDITLVVVRPLPS